MLEIINVKINNPKRTILMEKIGKEIQLNVIPIIKWEQMKKDRDPFAESIIRNHVLIKGVEL